MNNYCPIDGFPLDEDGCERCERSAAAEQADDDATDYYFEDEAND